jgi:hypothetical protein
MSQDVQTVQAEVMNLDTVINDKLVKANITDFVIAKLNEQYMPLKINGIEDKEGYKKVVEARKECKKIRVLASKICKEGREEANKISKKWVEKEKEVTDKIGEVEEYLQKQEDEYDAEKEKRDNEEKERVQKLYLERHAELTQYGAFFNGSDYILGEATIELSNVKSLDDEMFNEKVAPKFKAIFDRLQAEKEEKERNQREAEAELERQREEFRKQQEQLEKEKEQLRLQQEEADKKEKDRLQNRFKNRTDQLLSMGLRYEYAYDAYMFADVSVDNKTEISVLEDDKWNDLIEKIIPAIDLHKKKAEEKKQAEIEEKKKAEEKSAAGKIRSGQLEAFRVEQLPISPAHASDLTKEEFDTLLKEWKGNYEIHQQKKWQEEQDKKKAEEEAIRQEALDNSKDKEKWDVVMTYLSATPLLEMRGRIYRAKMKEVKDFLQTIK